MFDLDLGSFFPYGIRFPRGEKFGRQDWRTFLLTIRFYGDLYIARRIRQAKGLGGCGVGR